MNRFYLMMINNRHLLILLLMIIPRTSSFAQLNIQFMPAVNGQSVAGLFTAQVQSTSILKYNGTLKITVHDAVDKIVLIAITPAITVSPGSNFLQTHATKTMIRFGNSAVANIVSQTGRFPENEYEYCFEFTGTENKLGADERVFENCYHYATQPVLPLTLVYPENGDALCNTRPDFIWQPAIPAINNCLYRWQLAEKKAGQTSVEAFINGTILFQQENILGFEQSYPPQLPELQKGKTYAWQVIAYQAGTGITRSEIWDFTIDCNETKTDSSKESYRQLSSLLNGNYYVSSTTLRFSLQNPYGLTAMRYSITDIADPNRKISNLPVIKVQTGLNKIDLSLEDIKGLKINKMYLLKVENIGDHTRYLQFIYKGNEHR